MRSSFGVPFSSLGTVCEKCHSGFLGKGPSQNDCLTWCRMFASERAYMPNIEIYEWRSCQGRLRIWLRARCACSVWTWPYDYLNMRHASVLFLNIRGVDFLRLVMIWPYSSTVLFVCSAKPFDAGIYVNVAVKFVLSFFNLGLIDKNSLPFSYFTLLPAHLALLSSYAIKFIQCSAASFLWLNNFTPVYLWGVPVIVRK